MPPISLTAYQMSFQNANFPKAEYAVSFSDRSFSVNMGNCQGGDQPCYGGFRYW